MSIAYKKKKAGRSTHEMANRHRKSALWVGIIGIGILITVILFVQNAKVLGIGSIGISALLVFARVFSDFIEGQVDRKTATRQF